MRLIKRFIFSIITLQIAIGCAGIDKKNEARVHFENGKKFIKEGKLEKAKEEFLSAKNILPSSSILNWTLYHNIGKILIKRGDKVNGFKEYEKALAIFPNSPELNYDIATVYFSDGKIDEAIIRLKVAKINITDNLELERDIYIGLGKAFYIKNEYNIAFLQFKKALTLDPLSSMSHYYKASIYQKIGKMNLAIKEYEKAIGMTYLLEEKDDKSYIDDMYKQYDNIMKKGGRPTSSIGKIELYKDLVK